MCQYSNFIYFINKNVLSFDAIDSQLCFLSDEEHSGSERNDSDQESGNDAGSGDDVRPPKRRIKPQEGERLATKKLFQELIKICACIEVL